MRLTNASPGVAGCLLNTYPSEKEKVQVLIKMRVRVRLLAALLMVTLFGVFAAPHGSYASGHGCAPANPPPVSGSVVPAPATSGSVLINEMLSNPGSTWNCSEVNKTSSISHDAWVELYNPHNQPYNLYAVHASFDSDSSPSPYYFPFGAAIAAHGYLVLFPNTYADILAAGAKLRLVIAGVTIDQVTPPTTAVDQSYARIPDGTNTWQVTNTPTIDASNRPSQGSPTPASTSTNQGQGSSGGVDSNGNSNSTPPLITGTQPAWSKLQLPTPILATTPMISSTSGLPAMLSAPVSNGEDLPRHILLTGLAIALALMLFWCWRLFSTR